MLKGWDIVLVGICGVRRSLLFGIVLTLLLGIAFSMVAAPVKTLAENVSPSLSSDYVETGGSETDSAQSNGGDAGKSAPSAALQGASNGATEEALQGVSSSGQPGAQDAASQAGADVSTGTGNDGDVQAEGGSTRPGLQVSSHVQDLGWLDPVGDGEVAGTTGRGLSLEALKIGLVNAPEGSSVQVQAHVAEIGWQDFWANPDSFAGTTGRSLAIQALRIKLVGPIADTYDIWYRVHSADFGWGGWTKNGDSAGTVGYSKSAQAVEVMLVAKDDPDSVPVDTGNAYRSPLVSYKAHVQDLGWQDISFYGAADGEAPTAGTTGRGLRLEALQVSLGPDIAGGIEVRAHVSELGWQAWTSGMAGTVGRSLGIEALQIRLTGDAATQYDVWYRVHSADYGWLGWTSNGDPAGSTGKSRCIQAVQIMLVKKNSAAPGDTTESYIGSLDKLSISSVTIGNSSGGSATAEDATVGQAVSGAAPLRSFSLAIDNQVFPGDISYRTLCPLSGWQDEWSSNGSQTNPENDGLQFSGIQAQLAGEISEKYDLWYRVYIDGIGWLGWASNGAQAGTDRRDADVTAIQVSLLSKGSPAPGSTDQAFVSGSMAAEPKIVYQAHSAEHGWMPTVSDGEIAGTVGEGLRLEALRVFVSDATIPGSVDVEAHVAEIGWQGPRQAPEYAGTVAKSAAIQAVKISLSGDLEQKYDVYYQVHSAEYGWLGWAKNGEPAGTEGLSLQAEAVRIKLVAKGQEGPSSSGPAYIAIPALSAQAHVRDDGWQPAVSAGGTIGTTGRGLSLEAFKLSIDSSIPGGISYKAHVSDIGWQDEVADGAVAGTEGQSKNIEAVQIRLTGDLADYFDVWYRAHVQDFGWLGWTSNGASAGTTSCSLHVEAIQVVIRRKGAGAPGATSGSYYSSLQSLPYIGFQNPAPYPQVSNKTVVLPGYCTPPFNYVSPSVIPYNATRTDCVNAFINRALQYLGTQYIEPWSTAPGGAVDCSGLVLQCLYATGMDMGWYNPYNHRWLPSQTYNSTNWYRNNTFMPVSTSSIQRGDVIYYNGHIAIYLGGNQIIDSWPHQGVTITNINARGRVIGAARPYVG